MACKRQTFPWHTTIYGFEDCAIGATPQNLTPVGPNRRWAILEQLSAHWCGQHQRIFFVSSL